MYENRNRQRERVDVREQKQTEREGRCTRTETDRERGKMYENRKTRTGAEIVKKSPTDRETKKQRDRGTKTGIQ
jgi:hypothetical protein